MMKWLIALTLVVLGCGDSLNDQTRRNSRSSKTGWSYMSTTLQQESLRLYSEIGTIYAANVAIQDPATFGGENPIYCNEMSNVYARDVVNNTIKVLVPEECVSGGFAIFIHSLIGLEVDGTAFNIARGYNYHEGIRTLLNYKEGGWVLEQYLNVDGVEETKDTAIFVKDLLEGNISYSDVQYCEQPTADHSVDNEGKIVISVTLPGTSQLANALNTEGLVVTSGTIVPKLSDEIDAPASSLSSTIENGNAIFSAKVEPHFRAFAMNVRLKLDGITVCNYDLNYTIN